MYTKKMERVDLKTARAKIGKLADDAHAGEVVILTKRGADWAMLGPVQMPATAENTTWTAKPDPAQPTTAFVAKKGSWQERNSNQAARDFLLRKMKPDK